MTRILTFIACLLATAATTYGQTDQSTEKAARIELIRADVLKYDKSLGIEAQRLIGDVRFRHAGALMYCDSAYLYNSSNSLDAFGNVRVVQGDTLTLLGDKLFYNGNTRVVNVRDNVSLRDAEMTLKTHTLDYDRKTALAYFHDGGTITSRVNENELVACEGIYASDTEVFYFRDSVVINNPKYRVETDTLDYVNHSEIAYFVGPTFIFSDENTIYCENGWYDTRNDISQFEENAYLDNGSQVLRGDSLWYDRNIGLGKAFGSVQVIDTAGSYLINGDYGQYLDDKGESLVTGRPEMIQYDRGDSLFLHGDTLMAIRDTVYGDRVLAYYGVRFFGEDLQGAADSLVYSKNDSLIRMYRNPALWSEELQITGDYMEIKAYGGSVDLLFVRDDAFMIDKAAEGKFNQIKGRNLTGYFRDNELYKALVQGNAESFYYATEENPDRSEPDTTAAVETAAPDSLSQPPADSTDAVENAAPDSLSHPPADSTDAAIENPRDTAAAPLPVKFIGVNKAKCSSIAIYLQDRKVQRIVFLTQPDGTFLPMEMLGADDGYLKGFLWAEERRPKSRADIFIKPPRGENPEVQGG